MTQAPMENTIADFWRMVMDYKIGSIVMLNNLEEQCEVRTKLPCKFIAYLSLQNSA